MHDYGLGLIVYDAYRPWYVTKLFWDATPEDKKDFVANPAFGSRHNRGSAVDLGLYDLETGEPVEMICGFDEFSERAYPDYPGGTTRKRFLRDLLIEEMKKERFSVYPYEWWHYDYYTWKRYGILNVTFEDLE
jgi:D-alanyl-D-alanine dipeptidase